ncbi:MAG: hypothetical protein ACYCPO_15550 [Acidobacteriaceae bacterium]
MLYRIIFSAHTKMTVTRINSIEIPEDEQGTLASLLRLTDPALAGLERALSEATPTLDSEKLVSHLRKEPHLAEVKDLDDIIGSLVTIAATSYSRHVNTDEIVQAAVATIKSDHVVELSDSEGEILANRLSRLAKLKPLELIAKGNILLRENDRIFRSAKVITDLRPICSGDDLKVAAGVIIHQLAIRAFHKGKSDTIYFALDSEDLVSVGDVIARAIKKEKALREFADSSSTPILTPAAEK